jgi:hypothetical protein
MDPRKRERIEANLFHRAHRAVEPWDKFPWHRDRSGVCDADTLHSSQALAIDVFGTLKVADPGDRDAILDRIAERLGLPGGGPWTVELEWRDRANRMRENVRSRTQVDARAESPRALIAFECKFTEADGGPCSQVKPIRDGPHRGVTQCDGNYRMQVNPVSRKEARCALSAKGIRYWEFIPEIFDYRDDQDYQPCPFRGPWYQWMRNLTCTRLAAQDEGRQPAFILVYADGPALPMAEKLSDGGSEDWRALIARLRRESVRFEAISFQEFITIAEKTVSETNGDAGVWTELRTWVRAKVENVLAARNAVR